MGGNLGKGLPDGIDGLARHLIQGVPEVEVLFQLRLCLHPDQGAVDLGYAVHKSHGQLLDGTAVFYRHFPEFLEIGGCLLESFGKVFFGEEEEALEEHAAGVDGPSLVFQTLEKLVLEKPVVKEIEGDLDGSDRSPWHFEEGIPPLGARRPILLPVGSFLVLGLDVGHF